MTMRWPWRSSAANDGQPSFPARQLFVLALCRICEPIAFMSIFPYVYYMVESFHVTNDDRRIAIYVGLITSSFTFAEFCAGVFWGKMSDRIGRKPVLIMGLIGTAISMIVFGFSPNLATAIIARCLGGLLNGNMGVLQTTVAEIVTVKEHQPRAYSIMPFVWCLGSIIGPALGGALAQPCLNYPRLFLRGTIFDRFPFLLPNLVCVTFLILGITIGFLFLEETHAQKRHRRDPGLECGKWLLSKFSATQDLPRTNEKAAFRVSNLYDQFDDPPPAYQSREGSPRPSTTEDRASEDVELQQPRQSWGYSKIFTRQVIFNIIGFGILAYHSVSFDQLMPVFLSTPKSNRPVELPFHFTGGLALSTKYIGFMLAVQGVYSMVAQLWLFPYAVGKFGTLRTFRFVLMIWPPLYLCVPYLVMLPASLQIPAVYTALIAKITFHVIAFPSSAILLANAAPSPLVLGTLNGFAASTASLSRALGPTVTGILHSKGLDSGYSVLAWWSCAAVCMIGAIESFWMEEVDTQGVQTSEKPTVDERNAVTSPRPESLARNRDENTTPDEEARLLSTRVSLDLDMNDSEGRREQDA